MQAEVLSNLIGSLIFLSAVLLIGQQRLDAALADVETVVERHLIMTYMLEGGFVLMLVLMVSIMVMVVIIVKVRVIVNVIVIVMLMMLSHDAGLDVVIGEFQVAVAPTLVESHHQARCLFGEL